jgi:hypothetical protein
MRRTVIAVALALLPSTGAVAQEIALRCDPIRGASDDVVMVTIDLSQRAVKLNNVEYVNGKKIRDEKIGGGLVADTIESITISESKINITNVTTYIDGKPSPRPATTTKEFIVFDRQTGILRRSRESAFGYVQEDGAYQCQKDTGRVF